MIGSLRRTRTQSSDSFNNLQCINFEDPVTYDYLTEAVTTNCGHTFNEHSLSEYLKMSTSCPLCFDKIDYFVPNYWMRNAASDASARTAKFTEDSIRIHILGEEVTKLSAHKVNIVSDIENLQNEFNELTAKSLRLKESNDKQLKEIKEKESYSAELMKKLSFLQSEHDGIEYLSVSQNDFDFSYQALNPLFGGLAEKEFDELFQNSNICFHQSESIENNQIANEKEELSEKSEKDIDCPLPNEQSKELLLPIDSSEQSIEREKSPNIEFLPNTKLTTNKMATLAMKKRLALKLEIIDVVAENVEKENVMCNVYINDKFIHKYRPFVGLQFAEIVKKISKKTTILLTIFDNYRFIGQDSFIFSDFLSQSNEFSPRNAKLERKDGEICKATISYTIDVREIPKKHSKFWFFR